MNNTEIKNAISSVYVESDDVIIKNPTSDKDIIFKVNDGGVDTEVMRVDGSTSRIGVGVSSFTSNGGILEVSNGITFPASQSACSNANTLDDYEEGTFTPAISFGAGTTGITYGAQSGKYTKIGNTVTVSGSVTLTAKGSSSGEAKITGLPFTAVAAQHTIPSCYMGYITFANQYGAYTDFSATTISLIEFTEAGSVSVLADTDFTNNSTITFSATYFVS